MEYNDDVKSATLKALMSGALSGGVFGLGAKVLGSKSPSKVLDLLKASGMGAAAGGGVAGGSVLLGSSLLGAPEADDPSAYTKRAALGGTLGGGLAGGAIGALASRGKVRLPKGVPSFISDYFKALRKEPASQAMLKGGLAGAGGLGAAAGYYASDEGMGADLLNNELRRQKLRELEAANG